MTIICVYYCSTCWCVISKEFELHHSIGSLIDEAHLGPKTDRDYLGCYCPMTFETAKGKKEKWCRWESNPGPQA